MSRARRRRFAFVAGLIALAWVGCAALPVATEADVSRGQARWPGLTLAELSRGREAYLGHCSRCHQPFAPATRTAEDWTFQVAEMRERAGLGEKEAQLVTQYLVTMSSRANPRGEVASTLPRAQ